MIIIPPPTPRRKPSLNSVEQIDAEIAHIDRKIAIIDGFFIALAAGAALTAAGLTLLWWLT